MNKINKIIVALLVFCIQLSFAQKNPILRDSDPDFIYASDPSAEVFNGKVYLYCSRDQPWATDWESMKDYAVLESSDLINWINHGAVLDPQFDKGFEYSHSNMNAPDAAYKDGWYYWYFPGDIAEIGVAKSRTPVGPWETAVTKEIAHIFDPTVFIDDDGQAYLYGSDHINIGDPGRHVQGVKLKDNMIEMDGDWQRLSEENVNEAVHVFKRNGIYYFCGRVGKITGYWMADSPLPKYAEYKGELAPDSPRSPNHTSVIEFNGEWYLFYHRGDVNHGSKHRRSVCFEKLTFREDGTIEPVVYTLDPEVEITISENYKSKDFSYDNINAVPPPKGSIRREAEEFMDQYGVAIENQSDYGKSRGLTYISNGDWSCYDKITFGNYLPSEVTFRVRASTPNKGGLIELRVDELDGKVIGTIPVTSTGGWDKFETFSTTLTGLAGYRVVYLRYKGDSEDLMKLNWIEWIPGKAPRHTKKTKK